MAYGSWPEDAKFSDDYRYLHWSGVTHHLTPAQSEVAQVMIEAAKQGFPFLTEREIMRRVHSEHYTKKFRVNALFYRNRTFWKVVLVQGPRRGTYRLDPNPRKKGESN